MAYRGYLEGLNNFGDKLSSWANIGALMSGGGAAPTPPGSPDTAAGKQAWLDAAVSSGGPPVTNQYTSNGIWNDLVRMYNGMPTAGQLNQTTGLMDKQHANKIAEIQAGQGDMVGLGNGVIHDRKNNRIWKPVGTNEYGGEIWGWESLDGSSVPNDLPKPDPSLNPGGGEEPSGKSPTPKPDKPDKPDRAKATSGLQQSLAYAMDPLTTDKGAVGLLTDKRVRDLPMQLTSLAADPLATGIRAILNPKSIPGRMSRSVGGKVRDSDITKFLGFGLKNAWDTIMHGSESAAKNRDLKIALMLKEEAALEAEKQRALEEALGQSHPSMPANHPKAYR